MRKAKTGLLLFNSSGVPSGNGGRQNIIAIQILGSKQDIDIGLIHGIIKGAIKGPPNLQNTFNTFKTT